MAFAAIVTVSVIYCCTDETEGSKDLNLSVSLINSSACKQLKTAEPIENTPASQSCIEYSYNQITKVLTVNHINAGFNCCPESLSCTVVFRNDTIIIQEAEKNMGCKCNCLYDLEMEVTGVESGKYQLRMIEPNSGTQNKLDFELDLQQQNQGTWCVTRQQYPWGK